MSSRVLRKLQGEKNIASEIGLDDLNLSDNEDGNPAKDQKGRKKQLNLNPFDLLNHDSLSESEVKEDDNESEPDADAEGVEGIEGGKKKRKKKKRRTHKGKREKSSEDNLETDEVEQSIKEVNRILGDVPIVHQKTHSDKSKGDRSLLAVDFRNFNPDNEMKRIFGSKVVMSEQRRRSRTRAHKAACIAMPKHTWPQIHKHGISMSMQQDTGVGYPVFSFEHSHQYQQTQFKFLDAVESFNPDNIVALLNTHPYHVDALLQLSDICRTGEDYQMAAELIERAIYSLEYAFHPLFNLASGKCRLDYRRQENRSFFLALFKHLVFIGQRGCCRTSLEFCKVLLSLDPDTDPLGVLLMLDFYALRAQEHNWFVQVCDEWENTRNLSQLPNFMFSGALAHYHLHLEGKETRERADNMLQQALITFPSVLLPLLNKCSIQPNPEVLRHSYFTTHTEENETVGLTILVKLYIGRSFHLWKEENVLPWLEENVNIVISRVDSNDPLVRESEKWRQRRYQGTPRNIYRHILLSEIKDVTAKLTPELSEMPVLSFDPLPPSDSIASYTRPQPRNEQLAGEFGSLWSMFYRSLLPNFATNEPRPDQQVEGAEGGGGPEAPGDLRRSVTSLLDAMRDLLSNIHPAEMPLEADGEESGDDQFDNVM